MKKILLTNYAMIHYTGSEIDTLTIADYFLKEGYEVTIFTMEYGYPLLNDIDKRIKLINVNNREELESKYDIIWAHHFLMLDNLLFDCKITADYIHYVSLSAFMDYESLPIYYGDLNLVSILSNEARDSIKKEGYDISKVSIFSNYALAEDFEPIKQRTTLKKIAIVSNHLPSELLDFSKICKKENYEIDIYGIGYKYEKVTKQILKKYDLVITIGRTVNQCVALGIPVYVYDRFGGDSYITKKNIENSYHYNFSGRYSHHKMSGNEIYQDVISNYTNCLDNLEYCQIYAENNFKLENMINNSIKKMSITEKFNNEKLLKKYPTFARRESSFVNRLAEKINWLSNYSTDLEYCQIYFDEGEDFSEDNSIKIPYYIKNGFYEASYTIKKRVNRIKVDFLSKEFCKIKRILINNEEISFSKLINCMVINNECYSINNDPYIILEEPSKRINIKIEFLYDDGNVFREFIEKQNKIENKNKKLLDDNKKLKKQLQQKENEIIQKNTELQVEREKIESILNSKSWKCINFFGKIKRKIIKK